MSSWDYLDFELEIREGDLGSTTLPSVPRRATSLAELLDDHYPLRW